MMQRPNIVFAVLAGTLILVCAACSTPGELDCLDSPRHTLMPAADDAPYQCVRARDACSAGFIQSQHGAEDCEANIACEFLPGRCYCPPDVVCICGGGPPPRCVVKEGE